MICGRNDRSSRNREAARAIGAFSAQPCTQRARDRQRLQDPEWAPAVRLHRDFHNEQEFDSLTAPARSREKARWSLRWAPPAKRVSQQRPARMIAAASLAQRGLTFERAPAVALFPVEPAAILVAAHFAASAGAEIAAAEAFAELIVKPSLQQPVHHPSAA